jgi:hypothetical protein
MMVSQKNSFKSEDSRVDAHIFHHQNFIVDEPASLYHHLAETRNKGCSRTIVFTYGIDSVSKFPRIAPYASNHVVRITEVASDQNKIHPSRNWTAVQFLGHCVRVDHMLLVYEAETGLVSIIFTMMFTMMITYITFFLLILNPVILIRFVTYQVSRTFYGIILKVSSKLSCLVLTHSPIYLGFACRH